MHASFENVIILHDASATYFYFLPIQTPLDQPRIVSCNYVELELMVLCEIADLHKTPPKKVPLCLKAYLKILWHSWLKFIFQAIATMFGCFQFLKTADSKTHREYGRRKQRMHASALLRTVWGQKVKCLSKVNSRLLTTIIS